MGNTYVAGIVFVDGEVIGSHVDRRGGPDVVKEMAIQCQAERDEWAYRKDLAHKSTLVDFIKVAKAANAGAIADSGLTSTQKGRLAVIGYVQFEAEQLAKVRPADKAAALARLQAWIDANSEGKSFNDGRGYIR